LESELREEQWRVESELREAKLRAWWPTLTEEQREGARAQFMRKFHNDPEFREAVRKVLRERG
jgi:hypothetical protein